MYTLPPKSRLDQVCQVMYPSNPLSVPILLCDRWKYFVYCDLLCYVGTRKRAEERDSESTGGTEEPKFSDEEQL